MRPAQRLAFLGTGALLLMLGSQPGGSPAAASGPALSAGAPAPIATEASPVPGPVTPARPRVYLDTTEVVPSGRVIAVPADGRIDAALGAVLRIFKLPSGGRLQAALDAARPGDVIELSAGATYVGNFVLPSKPGAQWIVIRSSAHDRLPPPGARVSPAQAPLMPKLVSPNAAPAVATAARAHHFRLVGIEVTTTSPANINLVRLEAPGQTAADQVPSDLVIDRCYIHGTSTGNIRRGIALNGARVAVVGSYLSEFHEQGADTQAIMGWNGPGPFKIVNNYLEAAGENVMFGGGDPAIPNLVPSDIEIRGNYFAKQLSWRPGDASYAGIAWAVKNLFELKNAARVLVDGNVFEYNWVGVFQPQDGFAIAITPRNERGGAPWSTVEDVTFTHNIIRHSSAGIQFLGTDYNYRSRRLRRLLIQHNLFYDIGAFPSLPDAGRLFQLSDGGADVIIDHNTAFQTETPLYAQVHDASQWPAAGFVFTNNIVFNNQGVSGDDTAGNPTRTLSRYFPNAVFAGNVIVGGDARDYPPHNAFPASENDIGFVDGRQGDYRLVPSSRYKGAGTAGSDPGADVTALPLALTR